jgi:hypothetical protein
MEAINALDGNRLHFRVFIRINKRDTHECDVILGGILAESPKHVQTWRVSDVEPARPKV